jgi:hypothetical protein
VNARIALCCALVAFASACVATSVDHGPSGPPNAAQCGWSFEPDVTLKDEASGAELHLECDADAASCKAGRPFMTGTAVNIGVTMPKNVRGHVGVAVDETTAQTNGAFNTDPCSHQVFGEGYLQLLQAGPATLHIFDEDTGTSFATWKLEARDAASLQLMAAGTPVADGGRVQVSVDHGIDLQLSAQAEDGTPLVTMGDGLYWVEDESLASFGEHDEPAADGAKAQLIGRKAGTTQLHALVSNVERTFELQVR